MSSRARLAILPRRDGDPAPSAGEMPSEGAAPAEILRCAERLGIPWRRVLLAEIESEQRLRRHLADVDGDCTLPSALTILSFSFLESWRVRDRIRTLATRTGEHAGPAARQLRAVFRRLTGGADRGEPALTEHLWFAYQRVLLLQRVSRAAARSRGETAERVAFVCARTRCCFEDAAWAVQREQSREPHGRLEAAVRRVREEGFLIPRAESEARSLSELRRLVRGFPRRDGCDRALRASAHAVTAPRRLAPSDAIGTAGS